MKIAVVSSIFISDLGYLEEGVARVLTRLGNEVTVIASYHYPFNTGQQNRKPLSGKQTIYLQNNTLNFRILRLRTALKVRSNIICFGLKKSIEEIDPDLVILIGVSDFFPLTVINSKFCNKYRTYAFIGQNYDMKHWSRANSYRKKIFSYLINNLVKGFLYRRSINNLSKIIFYTPDTEEIVSQFLTPGLSQKLQAKKNIIPLGYDAEDFFFDAGSREKIREQFQISRDRIVFITATRIDRSKKIIEILRELFITNKFNIFYILIGFIENKYKSEIEDFILQNRLNDNILCLPFMSNARLTDFFSASDFGIWLQSGASIQQAMGTGLVVFLKRNSTTSLLLETGKNGYYVGDYFGITISKVLDEYLFNADKRIKISKFNYDKFSYQSTLKSIMS